jgi:hypothetical protein
MGTHVAHDERVAVRVGSHRTGCGSRAPGADDILDDDLLTKRF